MVYHLRTASDDSDANTTVIVAPVPCNQYKNKAYLVLIKQAKTQEQRI